MKNIYLEKMGKRIYRFAVKGRNAEDTAELVTQSQVPQLQPKCKISPSKLNLEKLRGELKQINGSLMHLPGDNGERQSREVSDNGLEKGDLEMTNAKSWLDVRLPEERYNDLK